MRSLTPDQSQKLEFGEILNSNKKIFISADMNDENLVRIAFAELDKNYLFTKGKIKTKLLVSEARQRLNLIERLSNEPTVTNAMFFRFVIVVMLSLVCTNLFGYVGLSPILASFVYGVWQVIRKDKIIKTKENCQEIVRQLSVNEVDENPWTS